MDKLVQEHRSRGSPMPDTLPPLQPGELRILRRKQVELATGLSCASIYKLMARGKFPKQVPIPGTNMVGWWQHIVQEYLRGDFRGNDQ